MKTFSILLCVSLSVLAVNAKAGKTWALLAATAYQWHNYGMEADVYHAYQVLRQGGIPEDQIIVMASEDLPFNKYNPYPGQVFHDYSLRDVYKGVKVDYIKWNITKETIFAVMKGDKEAVKNITGVDGRVIESGPDDNIFIFLSGHGRPGSALMPWGGNMKATELRDALMSLHQENKYKNLVIFIDTCYSASMFEGYLPNDIGVYAMTASGPHEIAWSNECHSKAFVQHQTCLGGIFAINWVNQLQTNDRTKSTLNQIFEQVQSASRRYSNPKQFGDLSIAKKMQSEFFGNSADYTITSQGVRSKRRAKHQSAIPKDRLFLYTLKSQLRHLPADSQESKRVAAELSRVETLMGHADRFIQDISRAVQDRFATHKYMAWAEKNFGSINWSCYEAVMETVEAQCPGMTRTDMMREYSSSKVGVLVNLCNEDSTDVVTAAVKTAAVDNPLCGE